MTTTNPLMACQASDILQERLQRLHDIDGLTWRKIAALRHYRGIPAGTLCTIANGGDVPEKWYRKLGIVKERPRVRLVAQVPEDWKLAVQEAALAEGITVAEWLRDAIARELQLEE